MLCLPDGVIFCLMVYRFSAMQWVLTMSLVKMPDAVQSKGLFVNSKAVIVMHMKSMADIVTCEVREDILYNSYYTTVR